jgi:hypothetical protein
LSCWHAIFVAAQEKFSYPRTIAFGKIVNKLILIQKKWLAEESWVIN